VFEATPIFSLLSKALDHAALRQAVHTANIANAGTENFSRLEVIFDSQPAIAASAGMSPGDASFMEVSQPRVVSTGEAVRLDREMALMARDAVRYQALLGAFERATGTLRMAIREGREG
jgi:flagellar basal-body rod protein FlgB